MVSGGFDPVHIGHIRLLQHAALYGRVVVALNSDAWLTRKKGKPFMPWAERAEILQAMKHVAGVVSVGDADGTVCAALDAVNPDYFANGGDRKVGNLAEIALCNSLGIVRIYNVGGGKIQSSSKLTGVQ